MFCTNCGRKNEEGMAFCGYCGSPLIRNGEKHVVPHASNQTQHESAPQHHNPPPQVQYTRQTQFKPQYGNMSPQQYGPYGGVSPQGYANTPYARSAFPAPEKKKRKGLIIGLSIAAAAVIIAVVLLLVLPDNSAVVGTWFSDDRGVVLEFRENGLIVSHSADGPDEGTYTYRAGRKEGVITADDETFEFSLSGSAIDVDGIGRFKKTDEDFDMQEFISQY